MADPERVNHPAHYGGADSPYEHVKVAVALGWDYLVGNATKYIWRAGRKDPLTEVEDLEKAVWYLQYRIQTLRHRMHRDPSMGIVAETRPPSAEISGTGGMIRDPEGIDGILGVAARDKILCPYCRSALLVERGSMPVAGESVMLRCTDAIAVPPGRGCGMSFAVANDGENYQVRGVECGVKRSALVGPGRAS